MNSAMRKLAPGDWPYFIAGHLLLAIICLFGLALLGCIDDLQRQGAPLFVLVLLAIFGVFLSGVSLRQLHIIHFADDVEQRRRAAIMRRYPRQPWMLNPAWAAARLVDTQVGRATGLMVFCLGWYAMMAALLTAKYDDALEALRTDIGAWSIAGFSVLMTLPALNLMMKSFASWLRVGDGVLVLETLPGRIGDTFSARLKMRLKVRPASAYQLDLTCRAYGNPKKRRRSRRRDDGEAMVWCQTLLIEPAAMVMTPDGLHVPCRFDLPPNLPPSGPHENGTEMVWTLRVASLGSTGEFILYEWVVPVFDLEIL